MPSGLRFAVISLAVVQFVSAQVPNWTGELLLEPGLNSGKCMTASSNSDGASVTLQTCTGAAAQKWTFPGDGTVRVFGNKCLDVPSGNSADGTKLQIWTCYAGNTNQQFYYTNDYRLAWTNHPKCVDLTAGNLADNTPIQHWQCTDRNPNQVWNTGYLSTQLPQTSQQGQYGTNACGTGSSQDSKCQNLWINSAEDFCLWGPPNPHSTIGDTEREAVAWCTKSGRGTRVIPNGTLKGVHFVKTKDYVQVTGVGDFTKINILAGDAGGELDSHGADGKGNPIGGLVFGNTFGQGRQYHEWTNFMGSDEFCIRACTGPNADLNCNHIYDIMGCYWNIPANYGANVFENCDGNNDLPMGIYGTSTWYQGVSPTPPPHPAASSSNCQALPTVSSSPLKRKREGLERVAIRNNVEVVPTPPPSL